MIYEFPGLLPYKLEVDMRTGRAVRRYGSKAEAADQTDIVLCAVMAKMADLEEKIEILLAGFESAAESEELPEFDLNFGGDNDTTVIELPDDVGGKNETETGAIAEEVGGKTPEAPDADTSEDDGLTDVNSASTADLVKLSGIGKAIADDIIQGRPWKSLDDLVARSGVSAFKGANGPTILAQLKVVPVEDAE